MSIKKITPVSQNLIINQNSLYVQVLLAIFNELALSLY
jgi:hypothetical protein